LDRPDASVAVCLRAIELDPALAEAQNNLGNALKDQGRLDEALACFRRAVELKPDYFRAASNLVYNLHFHPDSDARTLQAEHRRWDIRFAAPLAHLIRPHTHEASPDRRLRIGYVSPDFRDHVVGRNLVPLLAEHDHRQFEIFCYSDVVRPDDLTQRLRGHADLWREIAGRSDDQVAQCVHDDGIDILVDLTLHMAFNRLLVFARKPAPVQVSFAGYPGTTGLSVIDYHLTDPYLDPPSLVDDDTAEKAVRLPDTFWCYDPMTEEPAVNSLPAQANGFVTFGCLNNFVKVNAQVLALWARVFQAVDRSRLLLLAPDGRGRSNTVQRLEQLGIARDRVVFVSQRPRPQYLELYHVIDLMLDTFPYNGHTTSLDALWMGVPVVTMAGPLAVGRAGLSQLTNLGMPELVARTPDEFVRIAVELAGDLPRLAGLRGTLRDHMRASPLMDAPRFVRGIEAAYRTMWQRWCTRSRLPGIEPRPGTEGLVETIH
jgi:predicted O-linked N-acetylglucosamine transferase (SPINDLY family)